MQPITYLHYWFVQLTLELDKLLFAIYHSLCVSVLHSNSLMLLQLELCFLLFITGEHITTIVTYKLSNWHRIRIIKFWTLLSFQALLLL